MNEKDFKRLIELHSDDLFRYLAKSLGDTELAKDLLQECFLSLWNHKEAVDGNKVKSYLFATAHNSMLKAIRHNKVVQTATFEGRYEQQNLENSQLIDYLLQSLGEKMRQCLILKDWQGFSIKEIAQIMQMSEENVKINLFRARIKLKELKAKL